METKGGLKMVTVEEGNKIIEESNAISKQLLVVFEGHFTELIAEGNLSNIVHEIAKQTLIQKANRNKMLIEQQIELIQQAKKHIEESPPDYHLANFVLRDSPIVKKTKNLLDLSWAMHQSNPTKSEVEFLIELIEREIKKIKED